MLVLYFRGNMKKIYLLSFIFHGAISIQIFAKVDCHKIRFSNVGWTDISVSTALATEVLNALGYETKSTELSVPMTFAGMKNKDIDIFLGNWMPSMAGDIKPYQQQGYVETIGTVLSGAKYTLAVPSYVYFAGVKNFADIAKFKDKFQEKIYGIESGNDGNQKIYKMIQENAFNLKNWKLIESSEQAMIMEVMQAVKKNKWIVFLGWEPHIMNKMIKMNYLDGGDPYFGHNKGESKVFINSRKNYSQECPAVTKFFQQFKLTIEDEEAIMSMILDKKMDPKNAARFWIKSNFPKVKMWLTDIKSSNGEIKNFEEFKKMFLVAKN